MKKHRFDLTVLAALATIVLAVLVATEAGVIRRRRGKCRAATRREGHRRVVSGGRPRAFGIRPALGGTGDRRGAPAAGKQEGGGDQQGGAMLACVP